MYLITSVILAIASVIGLLLLFLVITIVYQKVKHRDCVSGRSLAGRTALVTGGTAGMGLEVATELARRGARVLVACPSPAEGGAALRHIARAARSRDLHYQRLDLASLASTRRAAAELLARETRLDILVNNAGVGGPADRLTEDGINYVMQVNYFGTFLLTHLLLPLLKKTGRAGEPSRIVNVASGLHILGRVDIDHLTEKNYRLFRWETYANSKLCLVMFTRELAKRLEGENVVVNSLEPGAVGTRIFDTWDSSLGFIITWYNRWVCKTPVQGAQTTLHLALDEAAGAVSGEHFAECRVSRAGRRAHNDELSAKLWEESVQVVKINREELKGDVPYELNNINECDGNGVGS